jgi:hypothetical protein
MNRVSIDLKHCYGIKELKRDFDFSKVRAYAIYAPNGVMKSSLAETFQDAAKGTESKDRVFEDRKTTRRITDETGADIDGDRILVVLPYDPDFGVNEKTSTLLIDQTLRKEYEQLHIEIDKAKAALLKAVRDQVGSKANFEEEISSAFTRGDPFEVAVTRVKDELQKQKDTPFADVKYDIIFDEKVVSALNEKDLKNAVEDYIRRYNELLSSSTYFKKGTLDYYNAGQIAKSLADNGFFDALHTVNLKSSGSVLEIKTQKELEGVIAKEKETILKDAQLRKGFDTVARVLNKMLNCVNFVATFRRTSRSCPR